jgi:hypothetical protein
MDGVNDLVVGAYNDSDGGPHRGAVFILFLDPGGKVRNFQKISDTEGGFHGVLADNDYFGTSVACVDDLDGDGIPDIAVGSAVLTSVVSEAPGVVHILFLQVFPN